MAGPPTALSYAVRPAVVLKYIGQLFLAVAALALAPTAAALIDGEFATAGRYAVVIAALLLPGLASFRVPRPGNVRPNEAMTVTALVFLGSSLVMSYPLMVSGLGFLDAFFEAVSASTTTGLSTLATVENKPAAFLFARAWMQWYGGLGIVVLSLALMLRPGRVSRGLAVTEGDSDDLIGGTHAHARWILLVYGALTVVAVLALWGLGWTPFDALVHGLAAVSTGGFATRDASLAGPDVSVVAQVGVIFFSIAGGVSFVVYRRAAREGWRRAMSDSQTWVYLTAGVLSSVALAISLWLADGRLLSRAAIDGFLVAFSAQSTAGFTSTDLSTLEPISKLLLIGSMAVGGGVGSTAGGFKILRLMIVARCLYTLVLRSSLTRHAVVHTRLGGRQLHQEEIRDALCVVLLFGAVVLLSWGLFVAGGYDPLDSLFDVVSATGTVGLSVGVTGPELPTWLKLVLCMDMLLGRLEIVAWLVLFYPRTWFGRRADDAPGKG